MNFKVFFVVLLFLLDCAEIYSQKGPEEKPQKSNQKPTHTNWRTKRKPYRPKLESGDKTGHHDSDFAKQLRAFRAELAESVRELEVHTHVPQDTRFRHHNDPETHPSRKWHRKRVRRAAHPATKPTPQDATTDYVHKGSLDIDKTIILCASILGGIPTFICICVALRACGFRICCDCCCKERDPLRIGYSDYKTNRKKLHNSKDPQISTISGNPDMVDNPIKEFGNYIKNSMSNIKNSLLGLGGGGGASGGGGGGEEQNNSGLPDVENPAVNTTEFMTSDDIIGSRPATAKQQENGEDVEDVEETIVRQPTIDNESLSGESSEVTVDDARESESARTTPDDQDEDIQQMRPTTGQGRPPTGQVRPGTAVSRPRTAVSRPGTAAQAPDLPPRPKTGARVETPGSRPGTSPRPSTGASQRPGTGASQRPGTGASQRPGTGSGPRPGTGNASPGEVLIQESAIKM